MNWQNRCQRQSFQRQKQGGEKITLPTAAGAARTNEATTGAGYEDMAETEGSIKEKGQTQTDATPMEGTAVRTPANGFASGTAPQKIRSAVDENNSPTVPKNSIPQTGTESQENVTVNPFTSTVLPTAEEQLEMQRREAAAAKAETESERGEAIYDGLTEEEYDAMADVQEAEDSMAGHSMLYEDGRQYSIAKEKGVEKQGQNHYNNTNHEIGGEEDGREVAHNRDWRVSQKHTGEQVGEGVRRSGKNQTGANTEGRKQAGGREHLFNKDSEGRRISNEAAKKLAIQKY